MKKLLLLTALAFAATAGSGFAQVTGQFGYGIEITGSGPGATFSGTTELYALDNSGTTRLLPTGSTATLNSSSWTGASTASDPTFNLGTFTVGGSLILDGGSYLTYKNSGGNVTAATLNYRVNSGSTGSGAYTGSVNLGFNEDNVNGNNGDQRWANEGAGINLLSGLSAGTYTLSTYGDISVNTGSGTLYENNYPNGDFAATFTVTNPAAVPEPGTWAMMLGGLGALVVFHLRRRQLVS